MAETLVLVPGDRIEAERLPNSQKRRLGNGVSQHDPNTQQPQFTSTIAGRLEVDVKKKSAVIATPRARYIPKVGDSVIAQVRGTSQDFFHLTINAHSPPAILPQLGFEGASKKTRPNLKNGDLIYAKVVFAQKNMEIELTCVNPATGKADGLGPLNEGMVFEVSIGFADRLLRKQLATVLEELGAKVPGGFELVVGKNGKVWVDCSEAGIRGILAVGRVLQQADQSSPRGKEQKRLVNKVASELGFS